MAPLVEYSTVAITKEATDENSHQTTEDGLDRIELLAPTNSVSAAREQPIIHKSL
jgi:hypothetical protein